MEKGTRNLAQLVLILSTVLASSGGVFGAWPDNPENNVPICTADGIQEHPRITTDGAAGAIIVWQDISSSSSDIYAQRVDARGEIRWTKDGVAICLERDSQMLPNLVSDGMGGAVIAWWDKRSGAMDIYAQRVNGDGEVLWQSGGEPVCAAPGFQQDFDITTDGDGGAIVTWHDYRAESGAPDIYVQRIDSEGKVRWENDGILISRQDGYQRYPTIASDGQGGAIITWHDWRDGAPDIYAQRVNADGKMLWKEHGTPICELPEHQWYAAVSTNADIQGGAIIAWMDGRNEDGGWDIYAQRVNAQGEPQWQKNGVPVCTAPGDQYNYSIMADDTGGAFIVWPDQRTGDWNIYVQRLDSSGTPKWTRDGLPICIEPSDQHNPNIVSDGTNGVIVAWWDARDSYADIYAQRIDIDGNFLWVECGTAISTADGRQQDPQSVTSGVGGAIITWWDLRKVDPDIYAQRIISE